MPLLSFRSKKKKKDKQQQKLLLLEEKKTPTKSVEFSSSPPDVSPLKTTSDISYDSITDEEEDNHNKAAAAAALSTPKSAVTASTAASTTASIPPGLSMIPPRPMNSRWKESDFLKVVRVWELSQVEVDKMRDLEGKLTDIDHWKNNPFEVVRFVKGPAGHKPAERLFRKMIDWRLTDTNHVDHILQEYTPPPVLLDYYPSAILHGLDHDGDPIYLERAGATDAAGLLKRFGHDAGIRHVIWLRELCGRGAWIQDHEERMGRPITQVTIVYDLAGLNARHLRPGVLPFFADMMSLTQSYYTGPVKRMIIIRCPALFRACWSVVKHVFPEEARSKMVFTGAHNHEEVLGKYMDLSVLPNVISPDHGRGRAADGMPQRFEGGIPPSYDYQEPVSSVKPDKLKKMISTMTETTTTSTNDEDDDYYSDNSFGNDNENGSSQKQNIISDSRAVLNEVYGTSSSAKRVSVSASLLGSGFFQLSEDGEIATPTIQSSC